MGKVKQRYWLLCAAALAAGLLVRLWFVQDMALVAGDSLVYGGIAKNWMLKGIYGFYASDAHPGVIGPTLIRLPGYPMFLVLCFRLFGVEQYRAVMNVQIGLDLGTCWLVSALSRRLFGDRAGVGVLWLAALCPFTANYVATPLTETLVLFTMALAFYGFTRWVDASAGYNRWLWVITAALAYSLLLRPEQGLLVASLLPAMLWRSLRGRERVGLVGAAAPVFVAGVLVLLPLGPWTVRNWRTFHVLQPLAPRYANDPGEMPPVGFARWYRMWAIEFASTEEVYWNYNGDQISPDVLPRRAFNAGSEEASARLKEQTEVVLADYNQTAIATPQIDARFAELARERIRAHPMEYYFALPLAKLTDMILRPRTEMMSIPLEWWRWTVHPGASAFALLYAALNLAYMVAGFIGLLVWSRMGRADTRSALPELAAAMAATVALRCLLLLTLDNSEPRYTLEFFPVLFIGAGALFTRRNMEHSKAVTLPERAAARNE